MRLLANISSFPASIMGIATSASARLPTISSNQAPMRTGGGGSSTTSGSGGHPIASTLIVSKVVNNTAILAFTFDIYLFLLFSVLPCLQFFSSKPLFSFFPPPFQGRRVLVGLDLASFHSSSLFARPLHFYKDSW
jgi:hypothetical protein